MGEESTPGLAAPAPALEWRLARARTAVGPGEAGPVPVRLPADLSAAIHRYAAREGVAPSLVSLTAFVVVLQRATGSRDLLVAGPDGCRRIRLAEDPALAEVLAQVSDAVPYPEPALTPSQVAFVAGPPPAPAGATQPFPLVPPPAARMNAERIGPMMTYRCSTGAIHRLSARKRTAHGRGDSVASRTKGGRNMRQVTL
jgi:hypothetical protein